MARTVTVGICTWNRATILARMLTRLAEIVIPTGVSWEVVVVDNNSTDETPSVLAEHSRILPLRSVREDRQGLAVARNRLVDEARGSYLLWIDDDILVEKNWLVAYVDAFRRKPNAGMFGGPIEPLFEAEPPPWLRHALHIVDKAYGKLNLSSDCIPLSPRALPYGANVAVKMEYQKRFRFDETPVRSGGRMIGMVDRCRFLQTCGEGWWVPEAKVQHVIPERLMSLAYLRAYYRGQGEDLALTRADEPCALWLGRPRWAWRQAIEGRIKYFAGRLMGCPEYWVRQLQVLSIATGRLKASKPRQRSDV